MSVILNNVSVPHPRGEPFPLVKNVSCEVGDGDVFAIIGPNGAGKSSLLKAIAGEWSYTGSISIKGVANEGPKRARQVAVLPQISVLSFPYRVFEVVGLGRIPHASGARLDAQIVRDALDLMDIAYLHGRLYTELSGGEKQRVQLARVIAQIWRAEDAENGNRVLLLDEPTAALDLGHQHDLLSAVQRMADQGVTAILVLHDINLAARYADNILALVCGQTLTVGRPSEVVTADNIRQLFGIQAQILTHTESGRPVVVAE